MGQFQLIHVNLQSLRLVLQIQLQLGTDLLQMGQLVPSVLALVLQNQLFVRMLVYKSETYLPIKQYYTI